MTVDERRRRRFSKTFRKEQVQLIESGKVTILEVARLYEVKPCSVKGWLRKFGTKKLPETIRITSKSEINRVKELEKQVVELKQIIGEQQIELLMNKKLIELASERLGEDFQKK